MASLGERTVLADLHRLQDDIDRALQDHDLAEYERLVDQELDLRARLMRMRSARIG